MMFESPNVKKGTKKRYRANATLEWLQHEASRARSPT
jgi:hypothetical protein